MMLNKTVLLDAKIIDKVRYSKLYRELDELSKKNVVLIQEYKMILGKCDIHYHPDTLRLIKEVYELFKTILKNKETKSYITMINVDLEMIEAINYFVDDYL